MAGKCDLKRRGMRPSSYTVKLQPGYPFSGPAFVTRLGIEFSLAAIQV